MEIKSKGIELSLSFKEAVVLTTLLGNMAPINMKTYGIDEKETDILLDMYDVLSKYISISETE